MNLAKTAKLIRMLSSPNQGEVLAAAHMLCKVGIHDVAAAVESGGHRGMTYQEGFEDGRADGLRWRPRRTRARIEIERLNEKVEELQGLLAKFITRPCMICGKPFVSGRADATTCSPRCRTRLHRRQRNG